MFSATWSVRAVVVVFLLGLSGSEARAQIARFIRPAADPLPLTKLPGPAPCAKDAGSAVSVSNAATRSPDGLSSRCDAPPVTVPTVNPCHPSRPVRIGCDPARDLVRENLTTMVKEGQKILRARERVLEILETENTCTAWFHAKHANPAATIRTLRCTLDSKGQEYVQET